MTLHTKLWAPSKTRIIQHYVGVQSEDHKSNLLEIFTLLFTRKKLS